VCFSAEASFAAGVALIPAGGYCLWMSALKKPTFVGLALVPMLFGIQQISEGFVWQGMHRHDDAQTRSASLVFLFFALAFWPFWFPVLTALIEPQKTRRRFFIGLALLATIWFWILYFPLITGSVSFEIQDRHHSIEYQYLGLPVYRYLDKTPLRLLYFASVALPPLLSSETWGRIPGIVLGASALLAVLVFDYAFVSVWCFFAAVLSVYICVVFYRLPFPSAKGPMSMRAVMTTR
jgi:hypothetical protein